MKILNEIACNLQIQFENNSNSIEEKWDEIWCKMY